MANQKLLCLRCRDTGHIVNDCGADDWLPEYSWMFLDSRMQMNFDSAWNSSKNQHSICDRCRDIGLVDILNAYPPWTSQDQLNSAFENGHELIRSLGKTGTIEFMEDCEACRCLFALTPNPSSPDQEILLLPDWTICRISGETGIVLETEEKKKYATCLIIVLKPSTYTSASFPARAHRSDALCLLEDDLEPGRTLGGRRVTRDEIDISIIKEWLLTCSRQHGHPCTPIFTPDLLNIHLVDVETREVVKHPGYDCDYVALSYVWGGVEQGSYKVGDRLKEIPRTLEDSVTFTIRLGKRYLWVDSLCIDQADHSEKDDQIQRMRSIYRGAYVTIIALSGNSANSGLPRISGTEMYQQITCCIQGKRLVGVMPTLSQQVWLTSWGQRAWTFQESRLSPRCLLLSNHQLYFECKGVQFVESLEHKRSWAHNLLESSNPTKEDFVSWMMKQGGAGCFRHTVDTYEHRLDNYGGGVNLYSSRKVKFAKDCLNAFAGMLQTFEKIYPRGFIEGLPIEDLDWSLLWHSRGPSLRRREFPSWCWAGWEGAVWYGRPVDHTKPRRFPINLAMQRIVGGKLELIFHSSVEIAHENSSTTFLIRNDPIDKAQRQEQNKPSFRPDIYPEEIRSRLLVIDSVTLTFTLNFDNPCHRVREYGKFGLFKFPVRKIACFIQIMSSDNETFNEQRAERTFVLIARDYYNGFIIHYLLLLNIKPQSSIAERCTALELLVPLDHLEILNELKPKIGRIVLA